MRAGVAMAIRRASGWALFLGSAAALAIVVIAALLERSADASLAVDRTLVGAVFGLAVPALAYALVAAATGSEALPTSLDALARHGVSRRQLALGVFSLVMVAGALGGFLFGVAGVVIASGAPNRPLDAALVADLTSTTWIGILAGASYAALFGLGSCIGKRGGGRAWLLVLDWLFGRGVGAMGVLWPRAHVRNLLGAEPVLGLSQSASVAALILLGIVCVLIALRRLPA